MVVANSCLGLAGRFARPLRIGPRAADSPAQREPLQRTLDRAHPASARVRPCAKGDLDRLGKGRKAPLRRRTLHLHPDDAEFRAALDGPPDDADYACRGRAPRRCSLRARWPTACGCIRSALVATWKRSCCRACDEGLIKSGRSARAVRECSGGGFIATGPDEAAVTRMVEWVRTASRSTARRPRYWPVLEPHGLGDLGRKLNVLSKEGKWIG